MAPGCAFVPQGINAGCVPVESVVLAAMRVAGIVAVDVGVIAGNGARTVGEVSQAPNRISAMSIGNRRYMSKNVFCIAPTATFTIPNVSRSTGLYLRCGAAWLYFAEFSIQVGYQGKRDTTPPLLWEGSPDIKHACKI